MSKLLFKFVQNAIDIFFSFWFLFLILAGLFGISIIYQFSINGAEFNLIFAKHVAKILVAVLLIFIIALVDKRFWNSYAYPIYITVLFLLFLVGMAGMTRLGAQRWIDLYFISLQPSELMKIAIILSLSRYYSQFSADEMRNIKNHIIPIVTLLIPTIFIMKQPDLGTAILLLGIGSSIIFFSKFPIKYIIGLFGAFVMVTPLSWFFLKEYQKSRILTFLDPDRDPLGTGYHILQSKIAIGSGGILGKGYANGTQSALNFLPEKNTDFIFTALTEEGGFFVALLVIILFFLLVIKLFFMANESKGHFERCLCVGTGSMVLLHAFINISMVVGIVPVVGVPIPFISYGGSSLLTFTIAIGVIFSYFKKTKNNKLIAKLSF